jgi:hypothetical protein
MDDGATKSHCDECGRDLVWSDAYLGWICEESSLEEPGGACKSEAVQYDDGEDEEDEQGYIPPDDGDDDIRF